MKEVSEWAPGDSVHQQTPNTQGASSDLFDGELFGDELIDIYNAAVGEGSGTGGHPAGEGEICSHFVQSIC